MESLKRFLVLIVLTACVAATAFAGDIPGPPLPPPPPAANSQTLDNNDGPDSTSTTEATQDETVSDLLLLILQLTVGP